MNKITIFSWGYWGWGNAIDQLVQSVDAVERARGFNPSLFVDIRMRRSVRAQGFRDSAFEKKLGRKRYRWFRSLGNRSVVTRQRKIVINDPSGAVDLLLLAEQAAKNKRRIIFFCSCETPTYRAWCHRFTVTDLLLKSAKKQKKSIAVIESPGGQPRDITVKADRALVREVRNGRMSIPRSQKTSLSEIAGLPHGSILYLKSDEDSVRVLSGPGRFSKRWFYPVFEVFGESESKDSIKKEVQRWRIQHGLDAQTS